MHITLSSALELLHQDLLIAVPTDTVYGLAALASSPIAIKKLFHLKGREEHKPINLLVSSIEQVVAITGIEALSDKAILLMEQFWPGSLTIVLPAPLSPALAQSLHSSDGSIGFRLPNHSTLQQLIDKSGPLAVTSANLSGHPSCKTQIDFLQTFSSNFPLLEGPEPTDCLESTIVKQVENNWVILRKGSLHTLE